LGIEIFDGAKETSAASFEKAESIMANGRNIYATQPQPSDSLSAYATIDHPISIASLMLIKILPTPMQNDS